MSTLDRAATAADIAAALRQIAGLLERDGSVPVGGAYVSLQIQPCGDEQTQIAAIDGIGMALNGKPGSTRPMSGGTFHHEAEAAIATVRVSAFAGVTSPAERALRAEIERLQAQLAATPALSAS